MQNKVRLMHLYQLNKGNIAQDYAGNISVSHAPSIRKDIPKSQRNLAVKGEHCQLQATNFQKLFKDAQRAIDGTEDLQNTHRNWQLLMSKLSEESRTLIQNKIDN